MSSPVRFFLDRRDFGRVHFPRAKGQTRLPLPSVQSALQSCFGVRVKLRRDGWWFGPKVAVFDFMGETIKLTCIDNGDGHLDLGHIDDEVRETILEYLRHSHDFDGR